MVTHDLHHEAQELLERLCHEFPLGKKPGLEWRNFRTTAGTADFNRWVISLSRHLLHDRDRLELTLRHEYAHLLAFSRHGRKHGRGHGPAWRQAMKDLGLDPQVYHRYPVQRNQPRQEVIYFCASCGERFSRKRRLTVKRKYKHRTCGGDIKLLEVRSGAQASSLHQ